MKTLLEWYSMLPPKYSEEAIKQATLRGQLKHTTGSLIAAICVLHWGRGTVNWIEVVRDIKIGKLCVDAFYQKYLKNE